MPLSQGQGVQQPGFPCTIQQESVNGKNVESVDVREGSRVRLGGRGGSQRLSELAARGQACVSGREPGDRAEGPVNGPECLAQGGGAACLQCAWAIRAQASGVWGAIGKGRRRQPAAIRVRSLSDGLCVADGGKMCALLAVPCFGEVSTIGRE
jgi:hypothetical protein